MLWTNIFSLKGQVRFNSENVSSTKWAITAEWKIKEEKLLHIKTSNTASRVVWNFFCMEHAKYFLAIWIPYGGWLETLFRKIQFFEFSSLPTETNSLWLSLNEWKWNHWGRALLCRDLDWLYNQPTNKEDKLKEFDNALSMLTACHGAHAFTNCQAALSVTGISSAC